MRSESPGMDVHGELSELRQRLKLLTEREALLAEIDRQTRGLSSPEETTYRVAALLGQFMEVNRCAYADVEADQNTFNLTGNYTAGVGSIVGRLRFEDFSQACLAAMRADEPFVVEDSETDPRTAEVRGVYRATEICSAVCVPLLKDGIFSAAMAVHCRTPRQWTSDEVQLVRVVANRCWESIERTRVLREFQDAQERLHLSLEAGCAGTFDWFIPEDRVYWTPELERLYGVPAGTFEGSLEHWVRRVHPDDSERIIREIAVVLREGVQHFGYDFRAVLPDGQLHWLHGQARFFYTQEGKPLRMIGINVDIHDRRMAEETLIRTEKLAAVGKLAASIAHEINNPLEAVTNLLYLARASATAAEADGFLDAAERELRRVAVISSQTLRFYKQTTHPREVSAEELLESVLSIFQGKLLQSQVALDKRMRARRPVQCFDGEIRQVLNNLLGNALDAIPRPGGRVLLRSRESRDWITGRPGLVLTVADNGSGIEKGALKRLFEPFFTTKGASGNGLGLWVSKQIVERHNGLLRVRSCQRPGAQGTVFTMFLPFEAEHTMTPREAAALVGA